MIDTKKIQTLSQISQDMSNAVSRLEEAIKKGDNKHLEELKRLILSLQRKTSQILEY